MPAVVLWRRRCPRTRAAQHCLSFSTSGPHTIQFCYGGDGAQPITAANILREVLAGSSTSISITSNTANPRSPLAPVVVSICLAEAPRLGGNPSGMVQVLDGLAIDPPSARCTIILTGTPAEVGSFTPYPLRAGNRNLSASFAASGIWAAKLAPQRKRSQTLRSCAISQRQRASAKARISPLI